MNLTPPHGGELKELYLNDDTAKAEKVKARTYAQWNLTPRQLCDVELLINGAFSPLDGFLTQADYERVIDEMRLSDGTLWPIPITLDVDESFSTKITIGDSVALLDPEGILIAVLDISDIWRPDKEKEAKKAFGTNDTAHPAVAYLYNTAGSVYLGGKLKGVEQPPHYDFNTLRHSPAELRDIFYKKSCGRVVAFQTCKPMHRVHVEITQWAAKQAEAILLIHPVVGMTKPGDIDHYSRVHCYEHVVKKSPEQTTVLSLLSLAMRSAGPREALWHAIIRMNYGCSHIIITQDHASPEKNSRDKPFYNSYDAQELVRQHQAELKIKMIPSQTMVYVEERAEYRPIDETQEGESVLNISDAEFKRRLREGLDIPQWFSYPEVVEELKKIYPPISRQGFTVFFTGLSGSGKSTVANALLIKLLEIGGRKITLLDGDIVRKNLSSELGFSREHRDLNIQRIGFVASEITKNGGVAICAPIAPYSATRLQVRKMIEPNGGFIEIHISTPIEVCELRDRKGLYAKARAGLIKGFTGIDDPYEAPKTPELSIDTNTCTPDEAAIQIVLKLEKLGYIK